MDDQVTHLECLLKSFAVELYRRNQLVEMHDIMQVESELSDWNGKAKYVYSSLPLLILENLLGFLQRILHHFFVQALRSVHWVREDVDAGVISDLDQVVVEHRLSFFLYDRCLYDRFTLYSIANSRSSKTEA